MLREQARLVNRLSLIANALTLIFAFWLAYILRQQLLPPLRPFSEYSWALLVILPVWFYLLIKFQLFASLRHLPFFQVLRRLTMVHLWGGVVVSALVYFVDREQFSRGLLVLFCLNAWLMLLGLHAARQFILGMMRRYGYNFREMLIVGTEESSHRFLELVHQHAEWGLRVVGFVQLKGEPVLPQIAGYPVHGRLDDLIEICKRHPVDEVVFCLSDKCHCDVERYVATLEELGTTSRMVLNLYGGIQTRCELSLFHDELPVLTIANKCLDAQQLFLKRILDLLGSTVGLILLCAMLPFIALAIKIDSRGPVFFGQRRVGMSGRIFKCWKFRSMYVDAEERKKELLDRNEMKGAIFKIANDPRITRVGRFLRKSSLDEFPQFWNVFKGEMSLVGTRPPTPDEVAGYENWHRRRISIKPGITGLWQVSGGNRINDFDEIVRLDIRYIETWSLWLDLKILFRTCWVLVVGRGAC